ncbi:MAG TPA: hypothetical protein V6C65_20035 [Allocoleopsis sp.]
MIEQPVTVHGLVCHAHVEMAITCFKSLLRFSIDPIQLVIHDDGSLTEEDQDHLRHQLSGATVISRTEADELMHPLLQQYPTTRQFRQDVPHAVKLLDVSLLSEGDIAFCDSDILFLKPFAGLFQFPDAETSALFMQDYLEAYSIFPWHLLGAAKVRLPSKINSGLIFMSRKVYDLDFIEWFLSQREFRSKPLHKMEQTCWAAMGYRAGCRVWNPRQVVLMRPDTVLTDEMVAGHFVKEIRYRLQEFVMATGHKIPDSKPSLVETICAEDCNILGLAENHFRRQSNRILSYRKKLIRIFN